jgi:hypothetical protein
MNPVLGAVAAAVLAGAVVAVSVREGRLAVVGLAATLIFAPLLADPLDTPLGLAARLAGGILAAYLLWIAVRDGGITSGSTLGWPAEALLAAAAFVVGVGTHGLGAPALGPAEAQAAGFALAALAIVPVATGRDVLRIGIGLFLLLQAALLVRVGLDGNPSELEQLVTAALVAALGGAVAALGYAARSDGPGGFELATESRVRIRRPRDGGRDLRRSPEGAAADGPGTRAPR